MGDMGEMFGALKVAMKEKRASNREFSSQMLRDLGIAFEVKNDGQHLIVKHNGKTADFWPGTGKYCIRGTGDYRRGVRHLLKDLGAQP